MEIFKSGRKSFVTVDKIDATKSEAIKIANRFFKEKIERLEVTSGTIKGETLHIGKGNVWVVSRRER